MSNRMKLLTDKDLKHGRFVLVVIQMFVEVGYSLNITQAKLKGSKWYTVLFSKFYKLFRKDELSGYIMCFELEKACKEPLVRMCHITKTCLFKYTENFTTKKWKFSDKKILIFFILLLKT